MSIILSTQQFNIYFTLSSSPFKKKQKTNHMI